MIRKAIAPMMIFAFLALALVTVVPCALGVRPPVSPWPPEMKWSPMSPEEAAPSYPWIIIPYSGDTWLTAGDSFCLVYGWYCFPTNVMYYYDTGEQATVPVCLQDHTDQANCIYTVKMNGEPLKPTGGFTGIGSWLPIYLDTWYIVPKCIYREYYIEFPQGLAAGTYIIDLYGKPCWGEPFSSTITLHVSPAP